jgi:FixJ family two-component response regulator
LSREPSICDLSNDLLAPITFFLIQRQDDNVTPITKIPQSIVFVVDDDPSVRESIERLLGTIDLSVQVFGTAREFLNSDRPEIPACLVLDVRLPGISGLDFQRELSKANIRIPIIFITAHGDVPMSVKAMKAGAVEFLIKPFHDQDLLDAVQMALERDRLRRLRDSEIADLQRRLRTLTPREREVLPLVISGLLNKQIAAEMNASEATVKVHRSQLMRKLEAKSVPDLVRMAEKLEIRTATPKPDPSLPK